MLKANFFVFLKGQFKAFIMIASLIIGILFLVGGLALRYWINRRRFYRRSPTGGEGFSSYESSVFIKLIERIGKWIAYAMIIFGLLALWAYSNEKKEKEKATIEQPVQRK